MKTIPVYRPYLGSEELKLVIDCIRSGWISSIGEFVIEFENRFATVCGTKYGVTTSSGTSALHVALDAVGVGRGDEVIVPGLSFVATSNSVIYTGATPVFIDIQPDIWCIDPEKIERRITKRTKAIIPVHLYGHPCDMDPILDIAREYGLYVIEDCAEAHGAMYKGRMVGGLGDTGCFSFYGNKIITTGEGGMIVTNNKKIAERSRFLKDHAMSKNKRYYHARIGYNYRLTNLQAAVGLAQLKKMEKIINLKRQIADWYREGVEGVDSITLPVEKDWAKNVYWMYSVLVNKKSGLTRDRFMHQLYRKGIDTRPFFYPLHKLPMYRVKYSLPVTEKISSTGVNLPSYPQLTKEEVKYICKTIKSIF